ncbi:Rv0909 family putative TA system antitoxin [Rathayibacter tanaceti]|uniref:Antitoxin n=2 Tax=Rathayibacter tanaceti TaxID=1671680 RepID=A0A162GIK0_9MICO|nr:Rv0909 family putative TA system antitoxin [Rathayibacter tanaceti]KZX21759.1 hypothetical protein ACH61_01129 [Rathayibacter tanaceti]QHC56296.1 antitoxin [Rathayibacter tanaceti]TCO37155.1 antitoxin protein of toxin-antitoxin system [Rathayibacter tanaceti]
MDLGKLGQQAGEFLNSEKAQEVLHSEQAEQISDQALEKGGDIASQVTKGQYDDRIEDLKRQGDSSIGTE